MLQLFRLDRLMYKYVCRIVFGGFFIASSFILGCSSKEPNTVTAPPPVLSPEELEAEEKRLREHYAEPSDAERASN